MALDQLLGALDREARLTADRLRAEATAEAARIATVRGAMIEHQRAAEVARLTRDRRDRSEALVAAVRRDARREALVARSRLLERVDLALADAFPAALASAAYRETLGARLEDALTAFADGTPVSARCTAELAALLLAAWPGTRRGEVRADGAIGNGFVLADGECRLEVEETLEARLDAHRGTLHREALRLLEVGP